MKPRRLQIIESYLWTLAEEEKQAAAGTGEEVAGAGGEQGGCTNAPNYAIIQLTL